jgi:2-oxoglutarate ferredoxin oxidoreductase subunit beta
MKFYKEHSKIKNGASTSEVGLTKAGDIIVGKFVDRERPDYLNAAREQYVEALGDRYVDECAADCCGEDF